MLTWLTSLFIVRKSQLMTPNRRQIYSICKWKSILIRPRRANQIKLMICIWRSRRGRKRKRIVKKNNNIGGITMMRARLIPLAKDTALTFIMRVEVLFTKIIRETVTHTIIKDSEFIILLFLIDFWGCRDQIKYFEQSMRLRIILLYFLFRWISKARPVFTPLTRRYRGRYRKNISKSTRAKSILSKIISPIYRPSITFKGIISIFKILLSHFLLKILIAIMVKKTR